MLAESAGVLLVFRSQFVTGLGSGYDRFFEPNPLQSKPSQANPIRAELSGANSIQRSQFVYFIN